MQSQRIGVADDGEVGGIFAAGLEASAGVTQADTDRMIVRARQD